MQATLEQVPHLETALRGPLQALEACLLENQTRIESWFRQEWQEAQAPLNCSVDLRNAGFKLAPVDTNLFPAGFNNLDPALLPLCAQAMQAVITQQFPDCQNVLLLPETESRNPHYWESLGVLRRIVQRAGYGVRIGFLSAQLTQNKTLSLADGETLLLEPVTRRGDTIVVGDFTPCLLLLNNDLSSGVPELLQGVRQPVRPGLNKGWRSRLKSEHFHQYANLCQRFAELIDMDPWLMMPLFQRCGEVDFFTGKGEDCMVQHAETLFARIQQKYQEYGVKEKPFVVVKADAGTYGMGVLMVDSAEQIRQLNRKQRNRMMLTKGSQKLSKVIIQEGVYTFETWEQAVAEPVVYMLGPYVVGGFYRVHTGKGSTDNLNAPGMEFKPLAFADVDDAACNRFYGYGVIARLAALAAAKE